jgi:hypothetical protein
LNKTTKKETKLELISYKDNHLSLYSLIIDLFSFTTFALLISILMLMYKTFNGALYENWVIIVVGLSLELVFIGFAVLDSLRKNPLERMYGSRIFNLPVFAITVLVITAIYWGNVGQLAIVYGAICGGFAGYLAGALAYGNFFVRIKDDIFRIVFGGWIGVSLGAIFGALFASLVDPFGGGVFGGIFMGFWGGAIVSGPIAVILLVLLEKNIGFRNFFSKVLVFDLYRKVRLETNDILLAASKDDPKIIIKHINSQELLHVKEETEDLEEIEPIWKKILRVLLYIVFLINPWEIESEIKAVNAYRDIFALYLSNKYIKSLKESTKEIEAENYKTESDAGSKLRQTVISALECIPVERSKNIIIHALNDPSCDVTSTAINTLGNLKVKEAIPHLQIILHGEIVGCWESKTNKTLGNKIRKNADSALAKIFEHPTTELEKLAGKIIYTDKEIYETITDLVPENLILSQDEIIQLFHILIEGYKKSQKMSEASRDQIVDTVGYIAIRLPPEEVQILIKRLYDENLRNLAKRIEKYDEVFV